jgi:hypothetical protein
MSAYIKLATLDYPRYEGDVRLDYPDIGEDFYCPDTYAPVAWVDCPQFDLITQRAFESAPVCVDDVWTMVWAIRDATVEEMDAAKPPVAEPVSLVNKISTLLGVK